MFFIHPVHLIRLIRDQHDIFRFAVDFGRYIVGKHPSEYPLDPLSPVQLCNYILWDGTGIILAYDGNIRSVWAKRRKRMIHKVY